MLSLPSKHSLRLLRSLCSKEDRSIQGDAGIHEGGLQILLVSNTLLYRRFATTHVSKGDRAVEIGCAQGHCTALFPCPAFGVDSSKSFIDEAHRIYPDGRWVCGDVFGDLSWLDRGATVLFVDIGGNRSYKPVMKSLAVCIPLLPALRLVVVKSIEVRSFLLRAENSVQTVARDLQLSKDDDAEAARILAAEIRRRGGELPVSLVYFLLCGPRLRYLVGKQRMLAFLKGQAPLLELVEVDHGPEDRRLRIRTAPSEAPPLPPCASVASQQDLAAKLCRQLPVGEQWSFLAVFSRLRRSFTNRLLNVASDPELYRQASDRSLDDRCLEPWSDTWQQTVAMRHLHAFIAARPEFEMVGGTAGAVATVEELCELSVRRVSDPPEATAMPEVAEADCSPELGEMGAGDGREIVLQILDANWRMGEEETAAEVKDLIIERAWMLRGERVVAQLSNNLTADANEAGAELHRRAPPAH